MARLIDANRLYDLIAVKEDSARYEFLKQPYEKDGQVNPLAIKFNAWLSERTNFKHMVADAPTIEAIPVEFIRGEIARMNQGANRYLSECATYAEDLENLIMEWERWGK